MKKSNVMIGMFVGVILVIGIVVFFTTRAKTAELETISLDTKPITDIVEKVGTLEKYYNVTSETVTIKSYDTKTELAKIRLDTPIDYKVGAGYQKVAQFTVSPYTDISSFIKSVELYNLNNDLQKFSRTIDIKYLSVGTKLVNDYKTECTEIGVATKNGTRELSCEQVVIGTHYEDEWKTYYGLLKSDKEITIGLFTNVEVGDKVEWIPTFTISSTDVKVQEWASWTADLNVGLVSYYKLDETSGTTAYDNLSINNGTISGATLNQSGKIGTAYSFDGLNDQVSKASSSFPTGSNAVSISAWIYPTSDTTGSYHGIIGISSNRATDRSVFNLFQGPSNKFLFISIADDEAFGSAISLNNWYHVVLTYASGSSLVTAYINGVATNLSLNGAMSIANSDFTIGKASYENTWFAGKIDEVAIYNRSLSAAEVTQLYNSGNGLPYGIPCNFSGYVKDSNNGALNGASVVIFNQDNKSEIYNTTTNVNGLWSIGIINSTKNYTAVAYFNNSLIGQAKPFIRGTC